MDLKEEDILGDSVEKHWYYRSKSAALYRLVKSLKMQCIMDIGAGSGFFSKELLSRTDAKYALCIDTSYPEDKVEEFHGKKIQFKKECGDVKADIILLMDVLEHVDDDLELLSEYVEKVPSGSHFLITVPAFSFLWSDHDVFLEHKRRYSLSEIEALVKNAGLRVEHGSYFFGLVFPLVVTIRMLGKLKRKSDKLPLSHLKRHNIITNAVLQFICTIDRLLLFKVNRIAGLSVFCLAEKP